MERYEVAPGGSSTDMTPNEAGEWVLLEDANTALEFAVAAERERCLDIVENYNPGGAYHIRSALADRIRSAFDLRPNVVINRLRSSPVE